MSDSPGRVETPAHSTSSECTFAETGAVLIGHRPATLARRGLRRSRLRKSPMYGAV